MKRLIQIVLINIFFVLGLSACSGSDEGKAEEGKAETAQTQSTDTSTDSSNDEGS